MKVVQGRTAFIAGGVVNGLQTFLPRIRAHGEGGHIINTASLAALVPMPAQFGVGEAFRTAENAGGTQVNFPSQMEPVAVGERRHAALLAAMLQGRN